MLNHVTPEKRTCPCCDEELLVSFDVTMSAGLFGQSYEIETVLSKPSDGAKEEDSA